MRTKGGEFNFAAPSRYYLAVLFVAVCGFAAICVGAAAYLMVAASHMAAADLAARSTAEAYRDKLSPASGAADLPQKVSDFNRLLESVQDIKGRYADIRVPLSFLEENHPDGLLIKSVVFDAQKAQSAIELDALGEDTARQYLNKLETSGVFKSVVVLKRKANAADARILNFKVEVTF